MEAWINERKQEEAVKADPIRRRKDGGFDGNFYFEWAEMGRGVPSPVEGQWQNHPFIDSLEVSTEGGVRFAGRALQHRLNDRLRVNGGHPCPPMVILPSTIKHRTGHELWNPENQRAIFVEWLVSETFHSRIDPKAEHLCKAAEYCEKARDATSPETRTIMEDQVALHERLSRNWESDYARDLAGRIRSEAYARFVERLIAQAVTSTPQS
jgi:hypothetical protein